MNDNLVNLIDLFDIVAQEVLADVSVKNYYGRKWDDDFSVKFMDIQDKGETLLQQVSNNSAHGDKLNKILNDLDNLWRDANKKGLI